MTPRVSIGLPVYNGERHLAEALDSILAQDFGDFELIISDNASTDATQDICEAYARRDPRITYSRLPENVGAARNYNRTYHMSTGRLFKWAAHDDRLHPAFLSRCVGAFDSFGSPPAIVHPKAEFIDEDGLVIGPDRDSMRADSEYPFIRAFQTLQAMNMAASVFGVCNKEILDRTGLIRSFIASDYVLLLEAGMLGKIIQLEGEPLFQKRIHQGMSRKANVSDRDVLDWFDPQARLTIASGKKFYLEYLRSPIRMVELSWAEKVLCIGTIVSGVAVKRTRVFAGKHRRRLVSRLARGGDLS
ncbi:glycosyltransferase [Deltaproteobacteria bacterium]|nr:glycosyltransferase [Deltaproteobacteria bacterium]